MSTRVRFGIVVTALEVQFWFPVWLLFLLDRGFTTEQAALADGVFRLVATLAEVPAGWMSDRIGRKRSLDVVLAGTAATFLLIATVNSLVSLLIAWSLWGVLWALVSGLLTAYGWELGHQSSTGGLREATEFVRIRRICAAIAMLLSLVTAGFLYDLAPSLPFIITAVLALSVWPISAGLPAIADASQSDTWASSDRHILLKGQMRLALTAGAIVLVAGWSIQMVFQPVGLEAALSPTEISLVFSGFALAQLAGAWLVGKISVSRTYVLIGSVIGIACCCGGVWLGFTEQLPVWVALSFVVAIGLFYAVGTTNCDIWVAELSTTQNRATMLSLISVFGGAALILTRPALGLIAGGAGASAAFGVWALVCAALALALWHILIRAK